MQNIDAFMRKMNVAAIESFRANHNMITGQRAWVRKHFPAYEAFEALTQTIALAQIVEAIQRENNNE